MCAIGFNYPPTKRLMHSRARYQIFQRHETIFLTLSEINMYDTRILYFFSQQSSIKNFETVDLPGLRKNTKAHFF